MKEQKQKTQNTKQNNKNQRFKIKMQNTNRNTKYKMPCHVPQAQIKKEVLKDKLQIKNPKHKYDVRQTYQTKPAKPNQTQPTKHTEPNLLNQNYFSKQTAPWSVVPLAMFVLSTRTRSS